jgi:hypothetical protein
MEPSEDRRREAERAGDPWRLNEIARKRRIKDDARRPLAVNLAEGLALSEFMARFKGAARK